MPEHDHDHCPKESIHKKADSNQAFHTSQYLKSESSRENSKGHRFNRFPSKAFSRTEPREKFEETEP